MRNATCTVPGCEKTPRSMRADLCPMHYHRKYRHGSVDQVFRREVESPIQGKYRRVSRRGHPLADKTGRLWEHRAVLYDTVGPGPLACFYCDRQLRWDLDKLDPAAVQVDHLNAVRDDNRPENLVPACRACNVGRGGFERSERLLKQGAWAGHDTIARLSAGGRKSRYREALAEASA